MWTAAILAGGKARRFGGRDKSALALDGRSILERQLKALEPVASSVMIVTSEPLSTMPAGVTVVIDARPGTGPLGAVWTALNAAPTPRVLALAADMPFVTPALFRAITARGRDADIVVPRTREGLEPLCAAYSRATMARLEGALDRGALSLHEFIASSRPHLRVIEIDAATLDPDGRLFVNLNTPEDYARALDLIGDSTNGVSDSGAPTEPGGPAR